MVSESKLKDFGYKIAFFILVVLAELCFVQFSILIGVSDTLMIETGVIAISPLFHLLPIIVIITLILSWLYLNKALTLSSYRKREKTVEKVSRKRKSGRFRKISDFFSKIELPQSFRRKILENDAFKGAFITLTFFISLALIVYLIVYPDLLYNFTYSMFKSNPSLLGFVIAIRNLAFSIGQTLSPLGWIVSSIDNGLKSAAPGFREAFGWLGSLIEALASLDANSKYVLCQNLAAWIPALTALAYGRYTSRPKMVRIKRRKRR